MEPVICPSEQITKLRALSMELDAQKQEFVEIGLNYRRFKCVWWGMCDDLGGRWDGDCDR